MAALLFLSFFLALGLGVVLLAMRGGPRGVRATLERGRRRPLHVAEFAVAGGIALFGLVVPAVVLSSDQSSTGPGRAKLSADLKDGRELFSQKCATCHTLEDAGAVGRVGPDLDTLQAIQGDRKDGVNLILDAIDKGRAQGKGQMPAQLLDGEDAKHVAEYVVDVSSR